MVNASKSSLACEAKNVCAMCVDRMSSRERLLPALVRARSRRLTCLFGTISDYFCLAAPRRAKRRIKAHGDAVGA